MIENFFMFLAHLEALFSASNPSGLLVLFALAVITDIGIPVPFVLDTILILTAYHSGPLSWPVFLIVIMLFVGRQIGSGILYLLSRFLGKVFLNWLKRHMPSIGERLDSFRDRFNEWSPLVVMTGRLTPGLLQITSITSGVIKLRYVYFAIGIALSSIIYDGLLVLLGYIAAHSPRSGDINFTFWLLISMIIIICVLWPIIFVAAQRKIKKAGNSLGSTNAL